MYILFIMRKVVLLIIYKKSYISEDYSCIIIENSMENNALLNYYIIVLKITDMQPTICIF